MEYNATNLERAVSQFYHTDANMQAQANHWLTGARSSLNAWAFVWELLQPEKTPEVQFFAATTLHMKIMKNWSEVPIEEYETLKKQILQAIINYSMGPKIILNRLCLALSAYVLQTTPTHWPSAISELLSVFSSTNLPSISPDKTLWILLEVFTVIPEEFQTMNFSTTQKASLRRELESNISQVICLVESIITESNTDAQLKLQAVKCISTWAELGLYNTQVEKLVQQLVDVTIENVHSSPEIVEQSIEALSLIITHPTTQAYPTTVINIVNRLLPLFDVIQNDSKAINNDLKTSIYGLFVSFAEAHPRKLLNSLVSGTGESTMKLIHIILSCSNAPGHYPTDESYSQLPCGFWHFLQDEMSTCEKEQYEALLPLLFPVYQNLALVLIRKGEFHRSEISAADKEVFRCYRQDIADSLNYCYNVLRESLLDLLLDQLKSCLQTTTPEVWQPLESILHGFTAVAESVNATENKRLPMFFSTLHTLPFNKLNIRVAITALDAVGAYAEWINLHPEALTHVMPLLLLGLENAETAPVSTLSLKDISRECQKVLLPYSDHLLSATLDILKVGKLKQSECVRLMYTVGRVLSILPMETTICYLNVLMLPCVDELQTLQSHEPNTSVKAGLLLRLKMLSMIFSTLDMQSGDEMTVLTTPAEQPVYLILERVLPVLNGIVDKWRHDSIVIQAVFLCLKHAVTTLLDLSTSLVPQILNILVSSYRYHPYTDALELTQQLCLLFGKNDSIHQSLIRSLLTVVIQTTLSLSLNEHTDIVESFTQLCAQLIKKNAELLISTEGIELAQLFNFATAALGKTEAPIVRSAVSFLSNFITQSREVPALLTVVQNGGEELVHKMLRCIGGESPRGNVETFAELLLTLNKKYCDNLSRWLQLQLSVEGFPSPKATPDNKQHFIKLVLRERANKRKLQETIRNFTWICRGLIGTEYAGQTSYF
uniref:Importin-13 n=1 Tax=Clastoptera arizonana TaxID=38151 RepID=A0A1B6C273_9HEMI